MFRGAKRFNKKTNAALRRLAEKLGLKWHERVYQHPVLGTVPLNGFCCGGYRGFAVFAGFMSDGGGNRGSTYIATVIEVSFPGLPDGIGPIRLKWVPLRRPSSEGSATAFGKHFRGPPAETLSDTAKTSLLALGKGATKLDLDSNRLLVVPGGGRIENCEELVQLLDRACDTLEILGAEKWLEDRADAVYDDASLEAVWERYRKQGHRVSKANIYSMAIALGVLIFFAIRYWIRH